MAKTTLLVPVDFNIESLNTLKIGLSRRKGDKVDVVLMYAESLGDSIIDLLFYKSAKTIKAMSSASFQEALAMIGNRYETTIGSIRIELFHGYNNNALENFTTAHGITNIYIPKSYRLKIQRKGFDPLPLLRKSKLPVEEIYWMPYPDWSEEDQLATLFAT